MLRFTTVMGAFLIFLVVGPMISGCTTLEDKMREAELSMIPWADDKEILFDPSKDKIYRHPTFYSLPDELEHM